MEQEQLCAEYFYFIPPYENDADIRIKFRRMFKTYYTVGQIESDIISFINSNNMANVTDLSFRVIIGQLITGYGLNEPENNIAGNFNNGSKLLIQLFHKHGVNVV
jgi:hypothetical protein